MNLPNKPTSARPKAALGHGFINKTVMGELIRLFAWEKTSLGSLSTWPQSLKTAVNVVLESPIAMALLWGPNGIMIYNDAYSAIAGAKHPGLLGSSVFEGWPEVADFNRNIMAKVLKGKTLTYNSQELTLNRNGKAETVWLDLNFSPVRDEIGKPAGVLAVVVEIRDRLQAEQDRLYRLFMQASVLIATFQGPTFIVEKVNKTVLGIWGKSYEQVINKPLFESLPELKDGLNKELNDIYTTGEPFITSEIPVQLKRKGKLDTAYFNYVYQPLRDLDDKIYGIILIGTEVTEAVNARKQIEQSEMALQQQLQLTETITNTASACLFMIDITGRVTFMNPAAKKVTGYSPKEAIGKQMHALVHHSYPDGSDYPESKCPLVATYTYGHPNPPHEDIFFRKDGTPFPALITGTPIPGPKGIRGTVVEFRDLTEEKRSQESQAESAKRFRTLANNIQNLAWMANPDGWIFWYNQRWYDYTGTTLAEMQGWGWKKIQHPDQVKKVTDFVKLAWRKGEPYEMTFPLRGKDGQYRWFLTRVVPVHDKDGRVERWIGTNTDIEDLKQRHVVEERMELLIDQRNALLRINKTKDEFIALASHQLRTPATAVKQYLGLLIGEFAGPMTSEQASFLHIAYDSNERELTIINDLLKTAQIDSTEYKIEKQKCNIVAIINDCVTHLQPTLDQKGQRVVVLSPTKGLKVAVDAGEIKLVFVNLLENASKYSYPGTEIKVSIQKKENRAEITITDKGVGISKANQHRIFDKFTRVDNELSDTVTGSGLGLYWVKQLLDLHKGSIRLTSALGKGSKFIVRLPL